MEPLRENQISTPVRLSRQRNGEDVALYSPFCIETPSRVLRRSNIKTVASLETPTRLRREVEELTANMQALAALTPTTLQTRRKSSTTLTNGSLKTPRSARRRLPSSPE